MRAICGLDITSRLMDALGLSGQMVRSIQLKSGLDEAVTVKVEMLVPDTAIDGLVSVMRDYLLVERTDEDLSPPEELPH